MPSVNMALRNIHKKFESEKQAEAELKQSRFRMEQESHDAENRLRNRKMANENMLFRAKYGTSPEAINSELESSTTGYSSPTPNLRKFIKNPMTSDVIESNLKAEGKQEVKPRKESIDYTPQAVSFINTYKPGDKDQAGNPITRERLQRALLTNHNFVKVDPNNPDIQKALSRFDPQPEPAKDEWSWKGFKDYWLGPSKPKVPGPTDNIKFTDPTQVKAQELTRKLLNRPSNQPSAPTPQPITNDLPSVQGVQEGSYLRDEKGARTHILQQGQWQPIQ